MIEVKLEHESPVSIMSIVSDLRNLKYVQDKDFNFSYYPSVFTQDGIVAKHTIFTFYDESLATWFALKYCK